ncbi:hypothetical protein [Thetidibacter halocola]|uniref:Uncharacterized protein n=1 Tax=Thetidibacter halocola TaxID=2827239 RepID=A0A8J7W8P9_9RHOB|nr:hypothetical protein [Thetidibacter halocola]MBS0122962.1 hypothetical protein [Thetidibacter halocola]
MSFNTGYFAVVNTSRGDGDTALLTYVAGGSGSQHGRGLAPRGATSGAGPLQLYSTHQTSMQLHYPLRQKFFSGDITDFRFRYDAAAVPLTVSGPAGSSVVPCRLETVIGGTRRIHQSHLVKLVNIGAITTLSPMTLGIPVAQVPMYPVVRRIMGRARQLAQTVNSQAQEMLVGVLLV